LLHDCFAKKGWSARLVKRARFYQVLLTESRLTRRLFVAIAGRPDALPNGGLVGGGRLQTENQATSGQDG
jgi:hypothetical protein